MHFESAPAATISLLLLLLVPSSGTAGVRFAAEGPHAGYGELLVLGPGARLEVELDGEEAQGELRPSLDGRPVAAEALASGWEPGRHSITGVVIGAGGAETSIAPLEIVYDPDAPTVDHEIGDLTLLEEHGLDQGVEPKKPRRVDRHRDVPVYWSADGRRWLPLLPPGEEEFDWLVQSDEPQVFFFVERDGALRLEDGTAPEKGRVVRFWAEDELSATSVLGMTVTPERVEIVVRDLVGNETRTAWALAR